MSDLPTRKIKLAEPLMVGGKEVSELTMRRALVRNRLDAQRAAGHNATPAEVEVYLLAALCDTPYEDLLEMPDGDYERLQEAYLFLRESPRQAPKKTADKTSGGRS